MGYRSAAESTAEGRRARGWRRPAPRRRQLSRDDLVIAEDETRGRQRRSLFQLVIS